MSKKKTSIDGMIEQAAEGKLSRRQFSKLLSATGISLMAMPLASRQTSAAGEEGHYFTWSGYDIPELFGQYREQHGVDPKFSVFGDTSEALAKVRAGYSVDVMHPCSGDIPSWVETGIFQGIDTSKLSNWDDVIPSLKKLDGLVTNGEVYFVPFDWGQTSITYRHDLVDFPNGEESWSVLWDERYKGKIGVIGSEGDTWWCAAIYAGVPFSEITSQESIDKVADVLRKQLPLVRMYTDDMTTLEQALASGEIVAAMTWNSSPVTLKAQGVPVSWAAPKEGALTWVCGAMLTKDAPHVDRAHDVIDSLISTSAGQFLINDYGYGHANQKSFDLISDERLAELGLTRNPDDVLSAGKFQIATPAEFQGKISTIFSEIKSGF